MAGSGAEKEKIRKQLKHRLRSDCGCELVPAVTANLSHHFALNRVAKETREALERRRSAKTKHRRDGWHAWLADQKQAGRKRIFAWLRLDEARWAPSPLGEQKQLGEADAAWWQSWGKEPFTAT